MSLLTYRLCIYAYGIPRTHHTTCFIAESPYHDVSGLPDPYMEQMDQDDVKSLHQQHMSLSYDENLESGYSTPNSRNRRVIREIIV